MITNLTSDNLAEVAAAQELFERAEAKKDKGKTGPKINGDSIKYEQGTTNENILRRLARDHESIFAKVKSGELSVNAAAIQAGIRKKPTKPKQPTTFASDAFGRVSKGNHTSCRNDALAWRIGGCEFSAT